MVVGKKEKLENPVSESPANKVESKFYKEQILGSKRYQHRRDILSAMLDDDKAYTHAEIERTIEKFLKGKVK